VRNRALTRAAGSAPLCASSVKRLDVGVAMLRFCSTAPFAGIVSATGKDEKASSGRFSDKKGQSLRLFPTPKKQAAARALLHGVFCPLLVAFVHCFGALYGRS
jgi:hypothetical protein